ncbi:hypothetical protein AVEN_142437-1 [Araneus ventricosus]|uniref:Uncharacterized protein n=1 Tax=Araneus ventricosus TaxID=182803 RepID=A0A4Y2WG17_ARAVE|nr:hypothetical protein AVEN_142437-1 [Araneus ventricosus]
MESLPLAVRILLTKSPEVSAAVHSSIHRFGVAWPTVHLTRYVCVIHDDSDPDPLSIMKVARTWLLLLLLVQKVLNQCSTYKIQYLHKLLQLLHNAFRFVKNLRSQEKL